MTLRIARTSAELISGRGISHHAVTHISGRWLKPAMVPTPRPCMPSSILNGARCFRLPLQRPASPPRSFKNNNSLLSTPVEHTQLSLIRSCLIHTLPRTSCRTQSLFPSMRRFLHLYSRTRRKIPVVSVRHKSSGNGSASTRSQNAAKASASKPNASKGAAVAAGAAKTASGGTGRATKQMHLLDRLQDVQNRIHRPTKEELLAAATGFWSRLRVRFKWFSIRELRPFNMDDISAFFSWILVGHLIWIIVGTTTFFSLIIFSLNTVFAQETIAKWIGNYLTKSSGLKVVFESAIVPEWRGGVITFNNVFVSRRPGQLKGTVSKGSRETAAADAAVHRSHEQDDEEDTNYTQFDLTIETINVTLSFTRWFNGRGLLRDVEMKGVRGVVDRTSVHWTDDNVDPLSLRHQHNVGDFELESFKLEDLLISIYQPNNFRPFSVSIFSADLPQLRKQWLFYDMLSANHMSGSFDESLFTIHPRQTHNVTGARLYNGLSNEGPSEWKKHSRIRIDSLNIDHLNRGVEGPFSWIREGNVDIVADIMFPAENEESIAKVMSDFYDRMEATVTTGRALQGTTVENSRTSEQNTADTQASAVTNEETSGQDDRDRFLIMDLRVHLNDVHASVPLFTRDLSYVNNALVRPIVAYINSKKAFIPVNCRIVKRTSDFNGSWTIYDSLLMDDLSRETYDAFARDVVDDQARMRRIKKVGMWSLQLAVQALFLGLAGNVA